MIFFIPVFASLWFLFALRRAAELSGWREAVYWIWFVVALLIQLLARPWYLWLTGLLAQVALALVLTITYKVDSVL